MGVNPTPTNFKTLTFDGENSRNYGVYITGEGVFNAPERNVEMVEIPGRNGAFALDKGNFNNIEVTYPAGIFADTESDFAQAVSDFRNLLCSKVGYVRLEDDYNPNEYRLAIYKSGLEVDHDLLIAGEFDLVFDCKPQRYLKSGETPITIGEYSEVIGTDNTPYLFRRTPQFSGEYDSEMPTLVGGSVVWNQLVPNTSLTTMTSNDVTFTVQADGTVKLSGTATADTNFNYGRVDYLKDHVYYACGIPTGASATTHYARIVSSVDVGSKIVKFSSNDYWNTRIVVKSGTNTGNVVYSLMVFDLTAMFGTAIAEYVYMLESGTAGVGVAWVEKLFSGKYYAYDGGTIESVEAIKHTTTGKNMAKPTYNTVHSFFIPKGTALTASVKTHDGDPTRIQYFDKDGNAIDYWGLTSTTTDGTRKYRTFTTKEDMYSYKFYYNSDTTEMQLELGSTPTAYEAYDGHEYTLDSDLVLRGLPKLDASNNLYYDGDEYKSDGSVTRTYATRAYQSGDESLADAITDGTNTVYKLVTPTTETADAFTSPQVCDPNGTEEYTTNTLLPVGHVTEYGLNPYVLRNPTRFDAQPLLEVEGYGDIGFNGKKITINNALIGDVIVASAFPAHDVPAEMPPIDTSAGNVGDTLKLNDLKLEIVSAFSTNVTGAPTCTYSDGSASVKKVTANSVVFTLSISDIEFTNKTYETKNASTFSFTVPTGNGTYTSQATLYVEYRAAYGGYFYIGFSGGSFVAVTSNKVSVGSIVLNSTKSALGHPTYIDLEIGEAYKVESGSIVSVNNAVQFPAELPTIPGGANPITYDNTFTQVDVVPRWWKV